MKRMFSSYIYKEENVYDRPINEYATGIDALMESERAKNSLLEFEESLWNIKSLNQTKRNPVNNCWQGFFIPGNH